MRHENVIPAEDHRRRLRAASYTMLVVVLVVVLAAIVVRPGRVIDLVAAYLIPVAVVLAVIVASLALLTWAVKRLPNPPYRDWWQ